jgi:tRNA modification GTPase
MRALLAKGARQALAGEFSFRAFRNGKVSLDQAESVADLISSQSEESSRRALSQLLGHVKPELALLKKELVDRLAEIEIDIDFSDQGLSIIDYAAWEKKLENWCSRVERIRQEFLDSQPLREGIRLALVGAPNSGKSSLFNRLLGEDRSIVNAQAGTTRDVVREALYLKGVLFRLSDTAGIRSTADSIESEGIDRSFGEVRLAQLVVWVFDATEMEEALEDRWAALRSHLASGAKVLAVWNKADQVAEPSSAWLSFFRGKQVPTAIVSAATGTGLPQLTDQLISFFQQSSSQAPDFLLSRRRHFEVLGAASEAVGQALEKVKNGEQFPDLLAIDLRMAMSKLGEITGEFSSDDLLNHIFAEFCIGK